MIFHVNAFSLNDKTAYMGTYLAVASTLANVSMANNIFLRHWVLEHMRMDTVSALHKTQYTEFHFNHSFTQSIFFFYIYRVFRN